MSEVITATKTWVGTPVRRKEDLRFVRGKGEYVDDRPFPDALHVAPVRSPFAHAVISGIETDSALKVPGVVGVVTGADLVPSISPCRAGVPAPYDQVAQYPLAAGKVRHVGEAVAAVVAESPYAAEDGVAAVYVDYDPLEPVVDPFAAMAADAPLIHGQVPSNVVWQRNLAYGDVDAAFARADRVVRRKLHIHRFTSAPLECRAAVVSYNPRTQGFTIFSNLQNPERYRNRIAASLGVSPQTLHFECPDIGGGFGIKLHLQWVILLCWLARHYGRPIKWIEDRTGHLLASHHGNEVSYDAELAVKNDGTILGLRALAVHDEGAYLEREPKGAVNQLRHATSVYSFRHFQVNFRAVMTNKCPTGPNRAYGKVQQAFLVERMIDEAARELGLDPAEMRRRNLVQPAAMPYETPTGALHDGGDYPEALRIALDTFGYQEFRQRQAEARKQGRYLGCGLAFGIEASPSNSAINSIIEPGARSVGDSEAALVRVELDGRVTAALGTVPQGHGHETVVAQIVADELGLHPDQVTVTAGYDSWRDPATPYSGTHASRFAVMGVGAVVGAARCLRTDLLRLAAHRLGADPDSLALEGSRVVDAAGGGSLTLSELARIANLQLDALPDEMEPGLEARFVYRAPFRAAYDDRRGNFSITYAYSISIVSVEVDPETGRIRLDRIICVDDCGKRLNPMIIEGQIHGAICHQVGGALFEAIKYDDNGQLLTANFKSYLTPTAADLPSFEVKHLETPSLFSPLGARGGGEGAGTPLVAAIGAVADALAPFGVTITEGHLSPYDVRRLIRKQLPVR